LSGGAARRFLSFPPFLFAPGNGGLLFSPEVQERLPNNNDFSSFFPLQAEDPFRGEDDALFFTSKDEIELLFPYPA